MAESDVEQAVDRLIDERPGAELLLPRYDDPAHPVADGIWRSGGTTAAYLIGTDAGRVVVNTGMGFEAPHHKKVFDAVHPGPTPYIITTQAHVDHVGGVGLFREPDTQYVAQANNPSCQADDLRIQRFRFSTAMIWFGQLPEIIGRLAEENPGAPMDQDRPTPDILFEDRLELTVGDLELELISTPGGETRDACVVWLPQRRTALVSNLFGPLFPHFPNFNTLRGDRYRFAEPYLAAVETVRALRPEVLITGRHDPIVGADLIDASLARLARRRRPRPPGHPRRHQRRHRRADADAGDHPARGAAGRPGLRPGALGRAHLLGELRRLVPPAVHDRALPGRPPRRRRPTWPACWAPTPWSQRAGEKLAAGEPVLALHLAEAVLAGDPDHARPGPSRWPPTRRWSATADGDNFWLGGWLRDQITRPQRLTHPVLGPRPRQGGSWHRPTSVVAQPRH